MMNSQELFGIIIKSTRLYHLILLLSSLGKNYRNIEIVGSESYGVGGTDLVQAVLEVKSPSTRSLREC